jgi:chromosomal replication initiation ATPase DnaA
MPAVYIIQKEILIIVLIQNEVTLMNELKQEVEEFLQDLVEKTEISLGTAIDELQEEIKIALLHSDTEKVLEHIKDEICNTIQEELEQTRKVLGRIANALEEQNAFFTWLYLTLTQKQEIKLPTPIKPLRLF